MQSSKSSALRALTSKIHLQLPLDPRESQKLLGVLTSSFQQQLDRHHPIGAPLEDHVKASRRTSRSAPPPLHVSSQASALNHFNSLLSNPLLAHKPRTLSPSQESSTVDGLRLLRESPLQWFSEQLVTGKVTEQTVYLFAKHIQLGNMSEEERKEKKPTTQMLKWLGDTLPLPGGQKLARQLMTCLVAEDSRDLIWNWLKTAETNVFEFKQSRGRLLEYFLLAENSLDRGLERMLATLHEASVRDCLPEDLKKVTSPLLHRLLLNPPPAALPENLYNSAVKAVESRLPLKSVGRAVLSLYHPTKPSSDPSLAYLKAFGVPRNTQRRWHLHTSLCLRLAHRLLSEGRNDDAMFVLDFAQTHFRKELGLPEVKEEKAAETEASGRPAISEKERRLLQDLDGLALI